jgi:predicted pyridoxine 5'-phosphate oxidase superfamily flavin-nucleotide-binding protein
MAKINNEMRTLLDETDIWVLATADSNGIPNAVPILFVKLMENNRLLLVDNFDNFMKKTVDNIAINPNVAISVWKDSTGYQFKGKAKIETSGPNYETGKKVVQAKEPEATPKGIILVDVDSIYITSPGPDAGKKID